MQTIAEFWTSYGGAIEAIVVFVLVAALNAAASPPADGKGESTLVLFLRHVGPDLLGFLRARAAARAGHAPARPSFEGPYQALPVGQAGQVLVDPGTWVYPPPATPPQPIGVDRSAAAFDRDALLRKTLNLSPPPSHAAEADTTGVESLEAVVERFEQSRRSK